MLLRAVSKPIEAIRFSYRTRNGLVSFPLLLLIAGTSLARPAISQDAAPAKPVLVEPKIPDYLTGEFRALNERLSKDVDPSQNMAVDLVQLFGPDVFEFVLRRDSLAMLGIESLSDSPRFQYPRDFVAANYPDLEPIEQQIRAIELDESLVQSNEQLWTAETFPELFKLHQANTAALDYLVAASRKPHYYAPLLSEEAPARILSASVTIERRLPYLARHLASRALFRLAAGQTGPALDDIFAGRRIALALANGSPLDISIVKAQSIDAFLFRTVTVMAQSDAITADFAREYLKRDAKLPSLPIASTSADIGERAILRWELALLQSDTGSLHEFFELPNDEEFDALKKAPLSEIRWDEALKEADALQDRFVEALAERDREKQAKLFDELDREHVAWNESVDQRTQEIAESLKKDTLQASRWIGETMAQSLRPWYRQRRDSDDRAQARRDMAALAVALTAYRMEKGTYPEGLAGLSPDYLEKIPVDPHTGNPLDYRVNADGTAVLICLGANRQDDAGLQFNDDTILVLPARK